MQKVKLLWIRKNILHCANVRWFSKEKIVEVWINFDKRVVWIEYPNKSQKLNNIENWQVIARICQDLE